MFIQFCKFKMHAAIRFDVFILLDSHSQRCLALYSYSERSYNFYTRRVCVCVCASMHQWLWIGRKVIRTVVTFVYSGSDRVWNFMAGIIKAWLGFYSFGRIMRWNSEDPKIWKTPEIRLKLNNNKKNKQRITGNRTFLHIFNGIVCFQIVQ